MNRPSRIWFWHEVAQVLAAQPPGTVLRLPKHLVEHPSAAGLVRSVGLPLGQWADFRLQYSDTIGMHVRDFGSHYDARLENHLPNEQLMAALTDAVRGSRVAALVALGALAGTVLGRKPEAVLAGAAVGGLLALLSSGPSLESPSGHNTVVPA